MAVSAVGTFTVTSWQEDTYAELGGKAKITKAQMGFRLAGDLAGDVLADTFMYYPEDGTAEYTGLQRFSGEIGGRSGTCVIVVEGGYDGALARANWRVIPGSGTGGLAGLTGSGSSVAAADPPGSYTLDYDLG